MSSNGIEGIELLADFAERFRTKNIKAMEITRMNNAAIKMVYIVVNLPFFKNYEMPPDPMKGFV
jgi:hypothetical protein